MPSYFPQDGDSNWASDRIERVLQKCNQLLYDALSSYSSMPTYFPEGNAPRASDTAERSAHKCLGLLQGLAAALVAGGSGIYLADDVADAKAQTTRYAIIRIPSLGWDFNWVATSTTAGDDELVLTPDDITEPAAGRYERFI